MGFPKTKQELEAAGYTFDRKATCKGGLKARQKDPKATVCGAECEFWTTPQGKKMLFDVGTLVPHWKTCKTPGEFRKNRDRRRAQMAH